jgi:hypothetical protein
MLADQLCPECHGEPELVLVRADRLVRRCTGCGHKWNEPHAASQTDQYGIDRKGWVRR